MPLIAPLIYYQFKKKLDIFLERLDVLVTSTIPFPHNSEGFLARVLNDNGNVAIYALEWGDAWFDIVRGTSGAQSAAPGAPTALRVASSSLWSCAETCQSAAPCGECRYSYSCTVTFHMRILLTI